MPQFRLGIVLGLALCAAAAASPVPASAQTTGEIRGTVTDASSQRPISGAGVSVVGSTRSTVTDARGTYTLRAVPAGNVRVRAAVIGYSATERAVAVAAGATATVDLALATSAVQLEGVVVSATGREQRVREIGNAVSTIQPTQAELATTQNLSQLLTARAPGLLVQGASGTAGTTSRIRIRGSNSVSLSNDPLLIIDGVRVDNSSASTALALSGQTTSRFDDINPEDVESIEVIKGPAGVALYGTAAANGVIQVTTKRGRAGRTRWTGYAEYGTSRQVDDIPLNYAQVGTLRTGSNAGLRTNRCLIEDEVLGRCTPRADSLYAYSPLIGASPFRTGTRRGMGVSVSGGSQAATYYLAVDREGDEGIVVQNEQSKTNLRANVRGQLAENLTVDVSTGYLSSRLSLPFGDNSSAGGFANGIRGSAFACRPGNPCVGGQGIGTGTTSGSPLDSTSFGYQNQFPPSELEFIENRQDQERFIGSANVNWRPFGWLAATGVAGMDINNRYDHQFIEPNRSQFSVGIAEGSAFGDRRQIYNYTANGTLTATRNLSSALVSTSSLGAQYTRESVNGISASGAAVVGGVFSLNGASVRFGAGEVNSDVITAGVFGQQQLAIHDRIYLSASLRGDDNSAFGQEFKTAYYPAANASWVISEEPFFPEFSFLDNLRLRVAYGESGQRPGFRQAETFFSAVSARVGNADVPAITIGGTGNPTLRPERSREYEFGFDTGIFRDRLGLEFTYYNKSTTDALVSRVLPGALGASATRFENLGEITNRGIEALVRANVVDSRSFKWDATASYSTNRNKIEDLGDNIAPIQFNFDNVQRHQSGYPAGSFFARRVVSFEDKNGDGFITRVNCPTNNGFSNPPLEGGPACELVLSDTSEFLGTALPTRQATFNTGFTFFNNLRLEGRMDYRGGQKTFNSSEEFRCGALFNCRAVNDRSAPLAEQARAVGRLAGAYAGYIEDASFWKLREVSATFTVPERFGRRMGASGLSLTVAGRNLAVWTDYTGVDPEVNSIANGNFSTVDFDAQPPVRQIVTRVNVNF